MGIGRCWNASSGPWRKNWLATLKLSLHKSRRGARVRTRSQKEQALFDRQCALLDEAVLDRIRDQDEAVFRFPGMFGGVAPLFNLVN